jgi:hypothetical protein
MFRNGDLNGRVEYQKILMGKTDLDTPDILGALSIFLINICLYSLKADDCSHHRFSSGWLILQYMTSCESDKKVDMYTVSKYTLWNITCHDLKICKKNYYMSCFDFKQKIFKRYRMLLLCDVTSSSILWRMKQMPRESTYQAL